MNKKELLESLSWYGCVIIGPDNEPVLFPASRMGYIMDGAQISDEEGSYANLPKDRISLVKCYFLKDGTPISPEQASEDFNYEGLGFQIVDLSEVSVSSLGNSIGDLFEYYQEDAEEFRNLLEYVMANFLDEDIPDKKYLAFAILVNDDDDVEPTPCLYVMNKLGKFYNGFMYKAQDKIFEATDGMGSAKVMEVQFKDGTIPINIQEAFSRMETEPENIFISAQNLGEVKIQKDFDSWDDAMDQDYDNTMNTLRMAMYALQEQAAKEAESDKNGIGL